MKSGRKQKNTVSSQQVLNHLGEVGKRGDTILNISKRFGVTKKLVKRALSDAPGTHRFVEMCDGSIRVVLSKYKPHESKRLHRKLVTGLDEAMA